MNWRFCLILSVMMISNSCFSQFATKGNGAARNDIWWFDWNGFNLQNGSKKTFQLPGEMEVTIQIDELIDADFYASGMNTWSGSILHLLYDFVDPSIKPALFSEMSTTNPSFKVTFDVRRDGQKIPYTIIAADAEASDNHEFTTMETSGGKWHIIQFFRNSNQTNSPVQGCGTSIVTLSETYGGFVQSGQNPVLATRSEGDPIVVKTKMQRVNVYGGMAVAFGILAPLDYGDLPESYGSAYHQLDYEIKNECNTSNPLPLLVSSTELMLGSVPGDSDQEGNSDDNLIGADEDALNDFPEYMNNGTYSLRLPVANKTEGNAFLAAWFDYNRNGKFETNERVIKSVPVNAGFVDVSWSGLPTYLPVGSVEGYSFRFRISATEAEASSPSGYSSTGEVEDYYLEPEKLCSFRITAGEDAYTCRGVAVQLGVTGGTNYTWMNSETLSNSSISNPVATPHVTTEFIVLSTNPQACVASDTVNVFVVSPPNAQIYEELVCAGEPLILRASEDQNVTYTWDAHPNLNNLTEASPVVRLHSDAIFRAKVSLGGCESQAEITVKIKPNPAISLVKDTTVCAKKPLILVNNGEFVVSNRWSIAGDPTIYTTPAFTMTPSANTKVYLEGTSVNGCKSIDSTNVFLFSSPNLYLTPDTITCGGKDLMLEAGGAINYVWKDHLGTVLSTLPTLALSPARPGTYSVEFLDANTCSHQMSTKVLIHQPTSLFATSNKTEICENGSIVLQASGGTAYSWYQNPNVVLSTQSQFTVTATETSNFYVNILDPICEVAETLTIPVKVIKNPSVTIQQSNNVTCKLPETMLVVSGADTYKWESNPFVTPNNFNSVMIKPTVATEVSVTGYNSSGCSTVVTKIIDVDFSDGIGNPSIPNAFTPNFDGNNDCFSVKNWHPAQHFYIEIYNRYGQVVFSANSPIDCWDGRFKGVNQPSGTYVYQIKANGTCGIVYKKGTLMLLR